MNSRFNTPHAAFAGIWLVFLAFPLWFVYTAITLPSFILVTIITVIFSTVYVWAFGSIEYCPRNFSKTARAWLYTGALAILILILVPIADPLAVSMITYLCAFVAFNFRPIYAAVILILLSGCGLGLGLFFAPNELLFHLSISVLWPILIYILALVSTQADKRNDLEKQLQLAQQREAIARDVHDLLGHTLTVISLKAHLAHRLIDTDCEKARAELADISTLSRTGLSEVRCAVTRLAHPGLDGEIQALRRALDTAGIALQICGTIPDTADPIFSWVLREAGTNILRHSHASTVTVTFSPHTLSITDNGCGFNPDTTNGGLQALTARVHEAGGELTITSQPGNTCLIATLNPKENP
ncbi:MAG: sensor histidine kinase [Corynebacterium sp.]|uniref:sensor histidine kinase n=1 Tax=Corynebacterium sp. TaxID=1720 RepID=UPI0026DC1A24|nr:sensor histidine kinase [Corynebacterium sp.]MDO4761731.1 sensor histidine kinase [Corynebacterium sp.]